MAILFKEGYVRLLRELIMPMEFVLGTYQGYIEDSAVDAICHGADLTALGIKGRRRNENGVFV